MIDILYQDDHISVAVKPSGMLSEGESGDSFPALLRRELNKARASQGKPPVRALHTVHRLDRETEGIMVYALTPKAAAELSSQIQNGVWSKIYTALLCGTPEKDCDRLCDLLYYDRARSKSFVVKKERKGVKQAVLDYSVLSKSDDGRRTAVRVTLGTGRTHQIRVQFASRGLPICGDRRYGAPAESGRSLCLCATELSFLHPKTKEMLEFKITPTVFDT